MSDTRANRWMVPALLFVAVLPFVPSLTFEFVLDDRWIVRGNEAIRGWRSLISLWAMPYWATETVGEAGLYRPAFMVVLSLLWNSGLRFPIFFHLMAVVAHAIATYLVWKLLRRGVPPASALVGALIFAAHPIHVEAVANITNSSEVIATVWSLLLVLLIVRSEERVDAAGRVAAKTALVAGILAAAAMFTKESGVTAPALALLALWGWSSTTTGGSEEWRSGLAAFRKRWSPVVIACGVAFIVVVVARLLVLGTLVSRGGIAAEGLESLTMWRRDWVMLSLGPTVVRMLLWPGAYNPMIGPRAIEGHTSPGPISAFGFMAAAVIVAWIVGRIAMRGDRRPAVAVAWVAIAFFPASNLLVATGQILAERTMYLPSVGIAMLAALASGWLIEQLAGLQRASVRVARIGVVAAASLALLFLLDATGSRAEAWRNHESLFTQAIAADSGDYRAHWRLASYRFRSGDVAGSLAPFVRAVELNNRHRVLCMEHVDALADSRLYPASVLAPALLRCQALP